MPMKETSVCVTDTKANVLGTKQSPLGVNREESKESWQRLGTSSKFMLSASTKAVGSRSQPTAARAA